MSPRPARSVLVVDGANVVGSVPDGWWKDRAGAARRLLRGDAPRLRGTRARLRRLAPVRRLAALALSLVLLTVALAFLVAFCAQATLPPMPVVLPTPSRSYVVTLPGLPIRQASMLNGLPSQPNPIE